MKFPLAELVALVLASTNCSAAPPTVYRCDTNGKISYSDAPCLGAKTVDVTPTQGADKMAGRASKGKEVQRDEFHTVLDSAARPLHGRSHEDMDVQRRRYKLSSADQIQCASLDQQLPDLEEQASTSSGANKGRADVALYQARKRAFSLKC